MYSECDSDTSSVTRCKTPSFGGRWSMAEDDTLRLGIEASYNKKVDWNEIAFSIFHGGRTAAQCQSRWEKVIKPGLIKGPWSQEEDSIVLEMVQKFESEGSGKIKWAAIANALPGRLGKQARERWYNHLDPNLKKSMWLQEEDRKLKSLQSTLGNRWCEIAKHLPGRSENSVKNRWNSYIRKEAKDGKSRAFGSRTKPKKQKLVSSAIEFSPANSKLGKRKQLQSFSSEHPVSNLLRPKRTRSSRSEQERNITDEDKDSAAATLLMFGGSPTSTTTSRASTFLKNCSLPNVNTQLVMETASTSSSGITASFITVKEKVQHTTTHDDKATAALAKVGKTLQNLLTGDFVVQDGSHQVKLLELLSMVQAAQTLTINDQQSTVGSQGRFTNENNNRT